MHGDPSCLHPSKDTHLKSTFKLIPVKSIPMYTCKPTKWHTLCNWLRIRAHGVLLNLWRLCILLESVEIMQRWDIMPPFSVLFPCLCHFILFFPSLILNLIFFSLPSQFLVVVLHPLLLSLYSSPSFFPLQSLPLLSASPP